MIPEGVASGGLYGHPRLMGEDQHLFQEAGAEIGPFRFPFELNEAEQRLVRDVSAGQAADLDPDHASDPHASAAWEGRTVRAQVLAELCTRKRNDSTPSSWASPRLRPR